MVVVEVVGVAVAVLGQGLLGRRSLHAARVGVPEGQVPRGGAAAGGVLGAAGGKTGHGSAPAFS